MSMQTKCTPAQRAAEYLKRVARLTRAEHVGGDGYSLAAGRRTFLVDYRFVRVISRGGKSTCFSIATHADLPSAEVVASALLQLKNDPELFKKWRRLPGYAFKADGKMFKDWAVGR
jgi:hypothetical protein